MKRRISVMAVAALPDELREAIVLRVWGQLTWNEVAAVTGMSSTSMQRRYASGLPNVA